LFTIKQTDFDKIKGNPNLTVIGHMTAKGDVPSLVTRAEEVIPLKAQGWKAF
jgi:thiamine-monophosphate kinase